MIYFAAKSQTSFGDHFWAVFTQDGENTTEVEGTRTYFVGRYEEEAAKYNANHYLDRALQAV